MNTSFADLFGDVIEEVLQSNGIDARVSGGVRGNVQVVAFLSARAGDDAMAALCEPIRDTLSRRSNSSGFSIYYAQVQGKYAYMLQYPDGNPTVNTIAPAQQSARASVQMSAADRKLLSNKAVQNFCAGRPYDKAEYARAVKEHGGR